MHMKLFLAVVTDRCCLWIEQAGGERGGEKPRTHRGLQHEQPKDTAAIKLRWRRQGWGWGWGVMGGMKHSHTACHVPLELQDTCLAFKENESANIY